MTDADEPTAELDIGEIVQRALAGEGDGTTKPVEALDAWDAAALEDLKQDIALKKTYATRLLWGVLAQMVIADVGFFLYASIGEGWALSAGVIQVWLGATLVQLIGVVLVVTQYLFPKPKNRSG